MSKIFNILIVDDTPKNIQVVASILEQEGFSIGFATDGEKALKTVKENDYDLILLDIMMPVLDGIETCKRLKSDKQTTSIPIIFLTAKTEQESILEAFEAGGVDYVTKPFNKSELLARVKTHLELKDYKDNLEFKVRDLTQEIEETQKEVIFTLGSICETRSKETGNHVKRVAEYSKILALAIGLSEDEAELLKEASPMHDVGKVGIPDDILNKQSTLNAEEWEVMKTHAQLGHEMLKHSNRPILKAASIVAYEHHEKWDGTGYPNGLKGDDIHIYGRITAIADVFDALSNDRCYKNAWADEEIFAFFKQERGKHFDPELVDLFFNNINDLLEIREKLVDS